MKDEPATAEGTLLSKAPVCHICKQPIFPGRFYTDGNSATCVECVLRSRLADAEKVLRAMKCPRCKGRGSLEMDFPPFDDYRCGGCNGTGIHPLAATYFECHGGKV